MAVNRKKIPSDFADIQDSIVVREKLIRIESHIENFKGYGKQLENISIALLGMEMNGKDGLVKKIDGLSTDIKEMNKFRESITNQTALMQRELNFGKWVFGIVFIALIGTYIKEKYDDKKVSKKEVVETVNRN